MTIHLDGFEQFRGEPTGMSMAFLRADYVASGPWATVIGRVSNSLGIAGRQASLTRKMAWPDNVPSFTVGFSHMFDARGSVVKLKVADKVLNVWLHPENGTPMLNDTAGGSLPTKLRWYYFEIEIDRVSGAARLYINSRLDCSTNIGAIQNAVEIEARIGYVPPAEYRPGVTPVPFDNAAKTFDDFYMRANPRLGPISITTRFANSTEVAQWFRSDPTEGHPEAVSHRPPKPLDNYVASDTVGHQDRFKSTEPLANTNTVIVTGVVVLARKADLLNAKLGAFIEGPGLPAKSGERSVSSAWRTQYITFDHTSDDSPANILASEFGIYVAAP